MYFLTHSVFSTRQLPDYSVILSQVDATTQTTNFTPLLDIPALSSFLAITFIFVQLQVRVVSIGEAVDRRAEALENLKFLKAKELEGNVTKEQVDLALETYRMAYD